MDLKELIVKAKQGDEYAFTELYNISYRKAYIEAMSFMKDDDKAKEALQLAYIKIANNIQKVEDETTFYKWVNTIVANTCKDQLRKRKEFTFSDYDGNDDDDLSMEVEDDRREYKPDENTKYEDDRDVVIGFINELPTEQRAALIMQVYDEMKISEIAEFFGTSENTIKSRLNYAKKTLKEKIEKYKKAGNALFLLLLIPYLRGILDSYEESINVSKDVYASISGEVRNVLSNVSSPKTVESTPKSTQKSVEQTYKSTQKIVEEVVEDTVETTSKHKGLVGMIVDIPSKVKTTIVVVVLLIAFGSLVLINNNQNNTDDTSNEVMSYSQLDTLDSTYIEYLVNSLTYDGSDTSFYTNFINNVEANGSLLSYDTLNAIAETGNTDTMNVNTEDYSCEEITEEYISASIGSVQSTEEVEIQDMPEFEGDMGVSINGDEYRIYVKSDDHQYIDVLVERQQSSFFGYTVLEYTVDNQKMTFATFTPIITSSDTGITSISSGEEACAYVFENDYAITYDEFKSNESSQDNEDSNDVEVINEGSSESYGYYYQVEVQWEQGNIYRYYVFSDTGKIICLTDIGNDDESVKSDSVDTNFVYVNVVVSEY